MTNNEAIQELKHQVYKNTDNCEMKISKDCYKAITNALEENTKLKAEIEQYQKETSADKIDYAYDLGYQSCLNHNGVGWVNAEEIQKLRKEIEQLKSELEKSVKLPCKVGDTIYRPVPKLYKDITKMKVKGFKIDEYGFRFETIKGTEWNCSSIGKTIFLTREEAEQHLKGKEKE